MAHGRLSYHTYTCLLSLVSGLRTTARFSGAKQLSCMLVRIDFAQAELTLNPEILNVEYAHYKII